MLKHRSLYPLDYSLCGMTVTVISPGGSRRVLENVHYECTQTLETAAGQGERTTGFLLVIPGIDPIAPGDKVLPGQAPDVPFEALHAAAYPALGVVRSVKPRYLRGRPCHTEARG